MVDYSQGGLSFGWSLMTVVFYQVTSHRGGLVSGWSVMTVVFYQVTSHRGGLVSEWTLDLIISVFHRGFHTVSHNFSERNAQLSSPTNGNTESAVDGVTTNSTKSSVGNTLHSGYTLWSN